MTQNKRLFILEKAIELFSKHGFEAVSIQDITNHSGISKGAFYLSFKSKDELMTALIEHLLSQVALIFDRAVKNRIQAELSLYQLFEQLLSFMRLNRGIASYFIHEHVLFQNKNTNVCILRKYEQQLNTTLGVLLERVYGSKISDHKQDLILSLNSLFHTYFEYVCLRGLDIEVNQLAQSLVEKINILAHATYKHALPNDKLIELSTNYNLSDEDLHLFKIRLLQDVEHRKQDETDSMKQNALHHIQQQLLTDSPDLPIIYAFSSLLKEFYEYEELALRLRAYMNIVHPQ